VAALFAPNKTVFVSFTFRGAAKCDGGIAFAANTTMTAFTGGSLERGELSMISLRARDSQWSVFLQTAPMSIASGTFVGATDMATLGLFVFKCTWGAKSTDTDSCWARMYLSTDDEIESREFDHDGAELTTAKVNEASFDALFFVIKDGVQLSEIRIGTTFEAVAFDPVIPPTTTTKTTKTSTPTSSASSTTTGASSTTTTAPASDSSTSDLTTTTSTSIGVSSQTMSSETASASESPTSPPSSIVSNASVDIDSASGPPFWAWIIFAAALLVLAGVVVLVVLRRKKAASATAHSIVSDSDSTTSSQRTQIYGDASNLTRPTAVYGSFAPTEYSGAEFIDSH
jgi:hypothetical protein